MANLNIKLVKSLNGRLEKQVATAHSMGLRKIGDITVQPDNDLGSGKLSKKLTVQASAFSASAKEAIEAAGGKAEVM